MARSSGEMPFLDHLEELRARLVRALVAVVVGVGIGIWATGHYRLVDIFQGPILPLLNGRHLVVQSPTELVSITLEIGFITGLVLASPVLVWQLWAFLSPALYSREKKAIVPALFAGLILFLAGAILSFIFLVPQALQVLLSFTPGTFDYLFTFEKYFSFVLQVVLAMGLSAELPLLIIMLAVLGVVTPAMLNKFRRFAIVLSFAAGAILSPGTDIISMLMMTAPLLLLYEVGFLGAVIAHRRRLKAAAASVAVFLALAFAPAPASAQRPPPTPPRPARSVGQPQRASPGDTAGKSAAPLDTASARRLGIPTQPKQTFAASDSIIDDLLDLEGFDLTRYRSDSAQVFTTDRQVKLQGNAMTERAGSTLEARQIFYKEGDCRFEAEGEPHLFQQGTVVVGRTVNYNTCEDRGLVQDGRTTFPQQGANWVITGNMAMDSSTKRLYASAREVTSCDLPESHYHFMAKELKWVNGSTMVARPLVLYIRDVPIAWLPFLFQDTKRGRRSGILIPEFGFNDIVRQSRNYNRTIKNIGYYWAPNDYVDLLARFDWFSNRYIEFGVEGQYRWIDRFMRGAISFSRSKEVGGATNSRIVWNHNQTFDVTTRLNVSLDYSTNSSIIRRNSIDPRLTTQQIRSSANLAKQFKWGNLTLGATRSQNVNDGSGTQTVPSLSLSPKPIDFGTNVTWSPDLNFTNDLAFKQPLTVAVPRGTDGKVDTLKITASSRNSRFTMNTPLRIGGFQWQNSVSLIDADSSGLREDVVKVPNEATPDPTDSITIRRVRSGGFGSEFDWNTGINLPILFRTSWKVTPSMGITNTTSGPFAVRNERTGGQFVRQGKRLQFGLSISPTFYGFFGGIGPVARIRHTIQPSLTYAYSPEAAIPIEFARAITPVGSPLILKSNPSQTLNLSLSQNFEGKTRRPVGDTTDLQVKKIRLLSITTSGLSFDLEKAKLPGRTGWGTGSLSNNFLSDLVPGLNLAVTHDLFVGQFDSDTAKFSPFLSGVTASFSLTAGTFQSLGRLFGLSSAPAKQTGPETGRQGGPPIGPPLPGVGGLDDMRRGTGFTSNQNFSRGQKGFNASVNLTLARTRPVAAGQTISQIPNRSNIQLNTSFAPTQFWQVAWSTQYDATNKKFEAQQLNLTRDLHDWRATFSFLRSPNGNFSFSFLVTLIDLPEIKFDYRQSTIQEKRP